ncbi:MAG: hypothetical protein QOG63_385 [Thermoleophilaceae bacterium]|jgi:hypothetical protein|nr:hypothetical protein [Thermoleophilaceae bacterium]
MSDLPSDNLPVLAAPEARVVERPAPEPMPLVAPVAAVTGGALAGLGAMVLLRVLRNGLRRQPAVRVGSRRGRRGAKLDIATSRSFLVDVHVLNRR